MSSIRLVRAEGGWCHGQLLSVQDGAWEVIVESGGQRGRYLLHLPTNGRDAVLLWAGLMLEEPPTPH